MLSTVSHITLYRTYAQNMDNVREKRSLGSRIRAVRTEQGISQRQLALMTGISRSYLWKIETGTADIGIDILICIARYAGARARGVLDHLGRMAPLLQAPTPRHSFSR